MNTELHAAAEQWVGIVNGQLVCHRGIIQFPMRKGWKRGHRMVVLPDYQGIGIGTAFENYTSKHYADMGWNVNITTTTPALVHALVKSERWSLYRAGRQKSTWDNPTAGRYKRGGKQMKALGKCKSNNRVTYSFNYVPLP